MSNQSFMGSWQSVQEAELNRSGTVGNGLEAIAPSLILEPRLQSSRTLLFVDASVADLDTLVAGANAEVHRIDPLRDAVSQITETLLGRSGIDSVQIISHGASGGLYMGQDWLNAATLQRYAGQFQTWRSALSEEADILLYGCNVGSGELGQAFVQILAQLSGADVAASDDWTGSAALGGDWDLEVQTGQIEAGLALHSEALAQYNYILPRPSNDAFANRISLTGSTATGTSTTIGATGEAAEPAAAYDDSGNAANRNTVWWTWRAPSSGWFTFDTLGSDFRTSLALFTGTSLNTLASVSGVTQTGVTSAQRVVAFQATSGTDYQIAVDGVDDRLGNVTLNLKPFTLPANDNFANRMTLTGNTATGSNIRATSETGEPETGRNTVWWTWTAPTTGAYALDTNGSNFNTLLSVYSGTTLAALAPVATNDDRTGAADTQSLVTFNANAGTSYQIAVAGFSGRVGTINLNLTDLSTAPGNDNFANRFTLAGSSATGTNIGATSETGEPASTYNDNGNSANRNTVWWTWTAPSTLANGGWYSLDTFNSSFDTNLSIYTGSTLNTLSLISSNNDRTGLLSRQSLVQFQATANTQYQIAVDGAATEGDRMGNVVLNLKSIPQRPTNDNFANRATLTGTSATGSNVGATAESGENPTAYNSDTTTANHNTVWWKWTAPGTGSFAIDTRGSSFDTFLSVFTGDSVNNLTVVGSNNDRTGSLNTQSLVMFDATAGVEYQIAVDGSGDRLGDIVLNVQPITSSNEIPVVTLPSSGSLAYQENSAPLVLDSTARVIDDNANLSGGSLTVSLTTAGTPADRLSILSQGSISLSGNAVLHDTTTIGTFSGGLGTAPLVISFNAQATPAIAQDLLRAIAFSTLSDNPSESLRTVSVALNDGALTSTLATRTIQVTRTNDAPLIARRHLLYAGTALPSDSEWTVVTPNGSAVHSGNATTITTTPMVPYAGFSRSDQVLDANAGFVLSFRANALTEALTASAERNGDGKPDRAALSVTVVTSDPTKAIEFGFTRLSGTPDGIRIFAQEDGGPSTMFTQAEGVDTTNLNLADPTAGYDLYVKGNTYTLFRNGVSILSGRLRDYTPWSPTPAFPLDPYEIPNLISFADGTTAASGSFSVGEVSLLSGDLANQTILEDQATNALAFGVFDVDGDPVTVNRGGSSATPGLLSTSSLTIAGSGKAQTLTITPTANAFGTADITLSANDGTNVNNLSSRTFRLTVTGQEDAATGTLAFTGTAAEGGTLTADISGITDVDGPPRASYQWESATVGGSWSPIAGASNSTFNIPSTQAMVGQRIRLTARTTDPQDGTTDFISAEQTIANVNDAPIRGTAIAAQTSPEDTAWSFTVPATAFSDDDGDSLTYSASLADGSVLPPWLSFNPTTREFTGTPPANFNGTLSLRVTARDNGAIPAVSLFNLVIDPRNDTPTLVNALSNVSVAEDTALNFTLPANTFTDVEDADLVVSATFANGDALPPWLTFNNGTFSGTPPLNFNGTLSLVVTARDSGLLSVSSPFDLVITPVNDAPRVINPLGDRTFEEDTAIAFSIPANTFIDVEDTTLSLSAALSNGSALPPWLTFTNGTFSGTPPLDFNGTLQIVVTARDAGQLTITSGFTLTITSENDAPTVNAALTDVTVSEDAAIDFSLPANTFADTEDTTLNLSATLANGTALPPWLTFNNGRFSGTPPANFNGSLQIRVTARDSEQLSASSSFNLNITPVNDGPRLVNPLRDVTVAEDTAINIRIPNDTFADVEDASLSLTASLGNGAELPSWLTFSNGQFTGTPPEEFSGTVALRVIATDAGDLTTTSSFNLVITAQNDAPEVANPLENRAFAEDTAFSFSIPANTFRDAEDATLILSASLETGSSGNGTSLPNWLSFSNGQFSGTPPQDFTGTLRLRVTATDAGDLSASSVFDLAITAVNDAPRVSNPLLDRSFEEDTAIAFTIPSDTFSDVDTPALTLSASLEGGSTLPAWLSFSNGRFSGTPPQDFTGTLRLRVTASDGGPVSASSSFSLDIGGINDAPVVVTPLATVTVDEDTAIDFTIPANTFVDEDNAVLALSATLADGSALPAWLSFDNGQFSGTPPANFNGTLSLRVTASDAEPLSASSRFDLVIRPVNDAPTAALLQSVTVGERQVIAFSLPGDSFSDVEDNSQLTLSARLDNGDALPPWLIFSDGNFSGLPPQDFTGTLRIRVSATDLGGLSVAQAFDLIVAPVNEAPVEVSPLQTVTVDEDTAIAFDIPSTTFSDPDGDNLRLSATLANGTPLPSWLSFSNGRFTGTPPENFTGRLRLQVTASDAEPLSASSVFDLVIAPVNDVPTVNQPLLDRTVPVGVAVAFTIPTDTFSDVDTPTLTLSASLGDGSNLPAWLSFSNGQFSGTPPQGFEGTFPIRVTARDGGTVSASSSFNLNIGGVNDAPVVLTPLVDVVVAEDTAIDFTLPANTFNDVDNSILALSASLGDGSSLPDWLSFEDGRFRGTPPQDFTGRLAIRVTASDAEPLSAASTFNLVITPVNDAPVLGTNTLTIGSGGTVVLSATNLSATDVDHLPEQLTYTASNVVQGQFEFVANPGVAITRFTQADINSGLVQFVHNGSAIAPNYSLTVSDGTAATAIANVTIQGFTSGGTTPPVIRTNTLAISEGGSALLTATTLVATDPDTAATRLVYTATDLVNGRFELVSEPGAAINRFTQADVNGNRVRFVHNGSELAPAYTLTVSDGNSTSQPSLVTIRSFTPVNDAPTLTTNTLSLTQGGTVRLTEASLMASDGDTPAANLVYRVTGVTEGQFEWVATPGTAIAQFTQADITQGRVQFVHSGAAILPSYTVQVSDGTNTSAPSRVTIAGGAFDQPLVRGSDFNRDGNADIVWRNYQTGENVIWFMNSQQQQIGSAVLPTLSDLNWVMEGTGDFNRDGKSDILWRNYATGENVIWLMDGSNALTSVNLLALTDLDWRIEGLGDYDNDAQLDIVWRNYRTGQNVIWLMNGVSPLYGQDLLTLLDLDWTIEATGDYDNDGKLDIVWRNYRTGQNVVWLMDGTTPTFGVDLVTLGDPNWVIENTADYNRDRQLDILWRNYLTGENELWIMDGPTPVVSIRTDALQLLEWQVEDNHYRPYR